MNTRELLQTASVLQNEWDE